MCNDLYIYIQRFQVNGDNKKENVNCGQQFHQYQQNEQSHKTTQYISVFVTIFTFEIRGIKKTKVTSQGSQAWLWSSMPEILTVGI